MKGKRGIIIAGGLVGILSVLLVHYGSPENAGGSGFCMACFFKEMVGSIGLYRTAVFQYIKPEILGLILGAFLLSLKNEEFELRGGFSPLARFMLGIVVMIGSSIFLGCSMGMTLRLGGGDLNAIFGVLGFVFGVFIAVQFLKKGFSLKRTYKMIKLEGRNFLIVTIGLSVLFLAYPIFMLFNKFELGPLFLPLIISLIIGTAVGALAQKTRLCIVAGARDLILFKDKRILFGFASIVVFSLIVNLIYGHFNLGFENQTVAHTESLWNFLGMVLVGWGSVLLGGCPFRQLILAGEGDIDAVVTVIGLVVGAIISYNFGIAASVEGTTTYGRIAVIICFILLGIISYINSEDLVKVKHEQEEITL
jgi:YedE family putative selenium metabolism protein